MRWGITITLMLAWVGVGWGGDKFEIESLKGLVGVTVLIEDLNPEAEKDGLYVSQLKTDVELRLRKVGIRVLSGDEDPPGRPALGVQVLAFKRSGTHFYAYSLNVALQQWVILHRDQSVVVHATTWSTNSVGTVGVQNLTDLRDAVGDAVDMFANDFLAANPASR